MSLRRILPVVLLSAVALCAPSFLLAQSEDASKVEVFGGYSWYHPGGSVDGVSIPNFNGGWGGAFTYNLNNWAGLTADVGGHYHNGSVYTVAGGPKFTYRRGHFAPFGEVLFGFAHISPDGAPDDNDFALIAGGGLDYKVTPRFSIRPIQADYVLTSYNALAPAGSPNYLNGIRLQAGLVIAFGLPKEVTPTANCSAEPSAVDAGAPVTISVTPSGFLPKRTLSYSYAATGGKISGTTASANLDSTGMDSGNYTVTARVVDNGKGKNQRTASCQATFMVNAKHPPTLTVAAAPERVVCGDASTINAFGNSPDNRPLSYTCSATAGSLSGSGTHYTLDTHGVTPESTMTVNCTVTDDRNLSASASTDVKCYAAPQAEVQAEKAVPQANKFGSIEFKRDTKRPTRVDNEAKGELDRYADALAAAPDAKGVVVGYATTKEDETKKGKEFAALRAVNTKDYVSREKGIDAARIEPRTGSESDQRTDLWIVPAGATFPASDTTVVNESTVKAVPRVPLKTRHGKAHRKHKKAPESN
jgi:hypothetical protein